MALTAYRNIAIGIGSKSDILERLCMSDRTLGDYTRVRCGSHEIVSMQDCQNACLQMINILTVVTLYCLYIRMSWFYSRK